jgi:hypothetical protein
LPGTYPYAVAFGGRASTAVKFDPLIAPYFVAASFDSTTVELTEKHGITESQTAMGILLVAMAFHGRATKSIWEFIGLQLE